MSSRAAERATTVAGVGGECRVIPDLTRWAQLVPKLFVSYIPAAAGDRCDIVITEILAGYYEPDELVLPPLSGSCSPLCSRL